jgi:hypothetical protein
MEANSAGKVGIKQFVTDLFYANESLDCSCPETMQRQLTHKQSLTQSAGTMSTCA